MNTTTILLLTIAGVLIGYDIFAVLKWGYHGTISYDLLTNAEKRPIIAFAMGVVCGHLFWPQ